MAHYFKFLGRADLAAAAAGLGLEIPLQDDFGPLFQPISLGGLRVGNRVCLQPMEGCDGAPDGRPDELTYRRYQRFGAGGAKLIWAEATAVVPEGRATSRQLWINPQTAPDFGRMLQRCRQAHREVHGRDDDLVIGLQLTHSGRYSFPNRFLAVHDPILDPRLGIDDAHPLLSDDYLHRLVDHYVAAAKLAHQAGFQFVDVKQCHRYLLSELLAATTRPGPFGGPMENRTRLARNIIQAIRAALPGLLIATRLNVFDGIAYTKNPRTGLGEPCAWQAPLRCAWGTNAHDPLQPDLTEPLAWIQEMVQLGVACVNITMANPYATPHLLRPFEYPPPDGYQTPEHPLVGVARHFALTAQVQHRFPQLAVVGSGYSYLQAFVPHAAAANLAQGRCTFAGLGRCALAQPDFVRQLREHGQLDRKRLCRTFSYCTALMRAKHNELGQFASGCPPFDKEIYGPIWEAAKKRQG